MNENRDEFKEFIDQARTSLEAKCSSGWSPFEEYESLMMEAISRALLLGYRTAIKDLKELIKANGGELELSLKDSQRTYEPVEPETTDDEDYDSVYGPF